MKLSHYVPRARLVHKTDFAVERVASRSVLHIGMGGFVDDIAATIREFSDEADAGASLHFELARVARSLTGLDINPIAIESMNRIVPGRYLHGDITDPDLISKLHLEPADRFEVIVFADVIEHLENIGTALRNLKALLAPGGEIIISTSNAFYFGTMVKLLFNYESTHEEHTCHFSYLTLKRTIQLSGLRFDDFLFYTNKRVKRFDSWAHRIDYHVGRAISILFPQFAAGLIVVARS